MNGNPSDFEQLLRAALVVAETKAPRAADDLFRVSSQAAQAVAAVTGGAAALELRPAIECETGSEVFQLILRKVGSEAPPTDLGMYKLTEVGYPILRWWSRRAWEAQPGDSKDKFLNNSELENHFRWLLSHPESRLVVLVAFFKQSQSPSAGERG